MSADRKSTIHSLLESRKRLGRDAPSAAGATLATPQLRLEEHLVAMVLEEPALSLREPAHVHFSVDCDPHAGQRRCMSDRGYEELAIAAESDEAAIEKMIDGWREEKAVLAV